MNKVLSIVIPVFNKFNFTKSCLKDLSQLSPDHEIIIIDNASSDETNKEMLELENSSQMKDTLIYVRNEENTFHSKACNQGYALSQGKYILFLNNDIRVKSNHSNWTQNIIDACESTNGIVGPTMGQLDGGFNFIKEANQQLTGNSYMGGWCIAAKRSVWEQLKIGDTQVWNEKFPMYFNDGDLSFRARKKNIPLTVVPLPDVVHFGKVSSSQVNVAKFYNEGRRTFIESWKK